MYIFLLDALNDIDFIEKYQPISESLLVIKWYATYIYFASIFTYPGRTERSVYGSKRIKYGIFTAFRKFSFTDMHLRYNDV